MEVLVGEDDQVIERNVWEKRKERNENKKRGMAGQKEKSQWVRCVVGVSVLGGARVVPKKSNHYFFFFDLLGRYTWDLGFKGVGEAFWLPSTLVTFKNFF